MVVATGALNFIMPDITHALRWIDAQRDAMAGLVERWAGINSGSANLPGLSRMCDELDAAFAVLASQRTRIDLPAREVVGITGELVAQPTGQALMIEHPAPDRPRALLCIHYDTVYGVEHPFQMVTRLDARTMRGPGVLDAKGGIVVILTALRALMQSDLAGGLAWRVLLTPDEEVGSLSSRALLDEMARLHDVGLVYEPTLADGSMASARKGSGNFTLVVRGRAAHAGREYHRGRNAIHALADIITELHRMNDELAGVTVNVGRVDGGGPVNVVPDMAIARFNVRMTDPEQQRAVETRLADLLARVNARDGYVATLHGSITSPPKPIDPPMQQLMDLVTDCGRSVGVPITWQATGGVCDGNKLAAAGLPTVDTLGPCGAGMHSSDEHLLIDSLTERARLTFAILARLATDGCAPGRDASAEART